MSFEAMRCVGDALAWSTGKLPKTLTAKRAAVGLAGFARGQDLFEQANLLLLHRHEVAPALLAQVIELLVQADDFEFSFEVDFIIVRGVEAILRGLPVLRHHDDGRLQRSEHREEEVKQDEGIRVERLAASREDV